MSQLLKRTFFFYLFIVIPIVTDIPLVSYAHPLFSGGVYAGLRFQYKENGMDASTSSPKFDTRVLGSLILLGAWGQMKTKYLEFNTTLDVGEMLIAQQTYGTDSSSGIYINDYNLMKTQEEIQAEEEALKACQEDAKAQGLSPNLCQQKAFILQESAFFRELNLAFYFDNQQSSKLVAGFFNQKIGHSFLLDTYVLGLHFEWDLSKQEEKQKKPYRFELDAFVPDSSFTDEGKKSPVVNLRATYLFSEGKSISIFGTYMYDGDNLAGKILLPLWKEFFSVQINQLIAAKTGDVTHISCDTTPTEDELDKLTKSLPKNQKETGQDIYNKACSQFPRSSGHHVWLGFQGNVTFGKWDLMGTLIGYYSSIIIGLPQLIQPPSHSKFRPRYPPRKYGRRRRRLTSSESSLVPQATDTSDTSSIEDKEMKGLGFLVEFHSRYNWNDNFSTAFFFLTASGDSFNQRHKRTFNSFMSIMPQIRYTNIFFNGGINSYSSRRGLNINGISGKGYIVPGLKVIYKKDKTFTGTFTSSAYWAYQLPQSKDPNGKSGHFYGGELNLVLSYQLLSWFKPVFQTDLFFPGNFFATSKPPPLLFQIYLGADFSWG